MNVFGMKALRYTRMAVELLAMLGVIVLVVIYAQVAGIQDLLPGEPPVGSAIAKYGVRVVLTLVFLLAGAILGLLLLMARFPKMYHYPVEITAKNVETQYNLAKLMLSSVQVVCSIYFCILLVGIYHMEMTTESATFWQATGLMVGICIVIGLLYVAAARANK